MRAKSSTLISGVVAVGIYLLLVTLLLVYFNTRQTQKSVHYVKKNENRIRVSMGGPKTEVKKKKEKVIEKKKPQVKKKTKERIKKEKDTRKKVIKEKVVKKVKVAKKPKKIEKKAPPKKVNKPKDLFASVATKKKPERKKVKEKTVKQKVLAKKEVKSASELFSESLKEQKRSDSGIENAYLAAIEEKLKGWPAQSEYAGESVKVWLKVETDGSFIFKIRSASSNDDFNEELIVYLEQLQKFGFGPHKGDRAYEIDVEFIAKD
ncbi:MAG: hypothetical protein GQ531_08815 [Sulfurovum sp.]|nr:hypothetical protein [Sulfurovum sp.]